MRWLLGCFADGGRRTLDFKRGGLSNVSEASLH